MSTQATYPAMAEEAYGFGGMLAPHGIGERTVGIGHTGGTAHWNTHALRLASPGFLPRYASHVAQTDARRRRAAMAQARAVESARRARLHMPETNETSYTDETSYIPPVADEWRGVPLRTLTALAETGWHEASRILDQLDTAYTVRQYRRRALTALMAQGDLQSGDGRGTVALASDGAGKPVSRAEGVNGTEVRGAERWQTSQGDPAVDYATCWRILPDGTREPFIPPVKEATTETRRTVATVDTAGSYAARLARFGAVGTGETD